MGTLNIIMNYEGGGSLPLAQALFKVFPYPLATPPQSSLSSPT